MSIIKIIFFFINEKGTASSGDGSANTSSESSAEEMPEISEVPTDIKSYKIPLYKETEATAIARIQENRKYLKSIRNDWSIPVLTLPDIFINDYQIERFIFDADGRFIRMICRKNYLKCLYDIVNKNSSK